MKRIVAAAAALLIGACFHATQVEKPDQAQQESPQGAQPKKSEGGAAAQPRAARRPQKPGRPALAASPSGLLVPGAVEQIQQALATRGYLDREAAASGDIDVATSAAIRRFQSDEGIARTGNPDHETLRRLGLDADALFRKSSVKQDSQ
jgi:peptidoglycan hydrolase-like protein with peptidoglycan-binding domain